MGQLSTRVQRLRDDLRRLLDAPDATQAEINGFRDRVADLLLRVLSDERHPLWEGLNELEKRPGLETDGELYRPVEGQTEEPQEQRRVDPLRHLFMPHPGSSDPEARRLWRLQLLLQTAAYSPTHADRVADRLVMSVATMRQAANEAAASSVAMWSCRQYIQHLAEAVESLDSPDPPLQFRLVGRDVIDHNGTTAKISPQEAAFLSLLVEHAGKPVKPSQLHKAGVCYPAQVKNRLLERLGKAGIEIRITAGVNSYTLSTPHA